ncbi:unnamed protein product [Parajaminaea phylloscopi]
MSSPDASRMAILGAASNGWSPQRSHKRDFFSPDAEPTSSPSTSMFSPGKQASRHFDPNALRSHGLVSNSVFKKSSGDSPGPALDPPASPSRLAGAGRGSPSPARRGVGLGIGVNQSPTRPTAFVPSRGSRDDVSLLMSPSESDIDSAHQSAQPPRKSKGFEVLTKSTYVTNSPFKAPTHARQTSAVSPTRPLSLQRNPSHVPDRPSTPPSYQHSQVPRSPATPRASDPNAATSAASSSPASRGLLTSNRLHGPRQMGNTSPTKGPSEATEPVVHERRKTVTFEEEPEVQEFDRESSFDANSLRSADSNAGFMMQQESTSFGHHSTYGSQEDGEDEDDIANRAYWNSQRQQLVVVNGSPSEESASPDLLKSAVHGRDDDNFSLSSADISSGDTDTSEAEPASPDKLTMSLGRTEEVSFDKTWATAADETAGPGDVEKDSSFVSLGGLNRVDSMVDELLQAEILTSPPISAQSTGVSDTAQRGGIQWNSTASAPDARRDFTALRQQSPEVELPKRRGLDKTKPAPRLSAHLRESSPERQAEEAAIESQLIGHTLEVSGTQGRGATALPSLPNWSPLMFDEKPFAGLNEQPPASAPPQSQEPAVLSSPRRPGGRPHISRDAVLERVAKEKEARAEAEAKQRRQAEESEPSADRSMPSVQTTSEFTSKGRPSAPAIRTGSSLPGMPVSQRPATGPRPHPSGGSYEARPQPTPSPIEDGRVDGASPLDRLGEEMAAAAKTPDVASRDVAMPPTSPWFDSVQSLSHQAGNTAEVTSQPAATLIKRANAPTHLTLPSEQPDFPSPPSPALSTRSGLGPAPPSITPEQHAEQIIARRRSKNKGRRKRSMSTGDAGVSDARRARAGPHQSEAGSTEAEAVGTPSIDEDPDQEDQLSDRASIQADLNQSKMMLDTTVQKAIDNGFSNGLCRDISRIFRDENSPYKVKDRGAFEGVQEKISHSRQAGDVDAGKAWRKLRRPSDINEYADEMRAYRANENPKKAAGKVFVMVDSFQPANLPVPAVPSKFYCILDNGLHVVKTGLSNLSSAVSPIAQEFELIQHKNLEFSLTLFAHREPSAPASPTKREKTGSITKSFVSRLLRSPKKEKAFSVQQSERTDPLAAYTNREGAFGRVDLVFESVAAQCLGKCLVVDLPVRGVADPVSSISGHSSINSRRHADFSRNLSRTRGSLRLKLFYLPPMPSVPRKLMPENLRECILGMENAKWHLGEPQLSGTLTQQGGDCRTWRRRPVKAQGVFLICFNDVTKRPTVKIDLSKARSIDENWDPYDPALTKHDGRLEGGKMVSRQSMMNRFNADEEPDESYHVPNSFRLTFADGEVISFFTDTEEERKQWVAVMKSMMQSKRPPNPMWAQVAWDVIRGVEQGQQQRKPATLGAPESAAAGRSSKSSNGNVRAHVGSASASGVPATVVEETSGSLRASPMKPPPGAMSPTAVRRKQVPGPSSAGGGIASGTKGPDSPELVTASPAAYTPKSPQAGRMPSSSLSNPWSTPKQQQRFGAARPALPARPQSDLFTPVRKQSAALQQPRERS